MSSEVRASTRRRNGARSIKQKDVIDSDEEFWNQDAFADDEDDDSFDEDEFSDKGEDVIDSDFDEPEDEEKNAASEEPQTRRVSKRVRKGKYVDPALKENVRSLPGEERKSENVTSERPSKRAKTASTPDIAVDRSSLRKSTKAATAKADKVRGEREAEQRQRLMQKRERERNKVPDKMPTQDELLQEAKETAKQNKIYLEALLRLEEESKRLPVKKEVDRGPTMTVISREGKTLISFKEKDADVRAALFPQRDPQKVELRHLPLKAQEQSNDINLEAAKQPENGDNK